MEISQNPYVLIELCLTEMEVETGILLTPLCHPIIPPSCFSLLLCFILISDDQFLCLHIYPHRAHHSCHQLLALACKSTWPTSWYSPHQNNAESSVPIANSWEKESATARVICALLAGEVSHARPLLSGCCEGLLRNGLELERFLTLESSIARIICVEHKVDLTVQQWIFKSLYLTETKFSCKNPCPGHFQVEDLLQRTKETKIPDLRWRIPFFLDWNQKVFFGMFPFCFHP